RQGDDGVAEDLADQGQAVGRDVQGVVRRQQVQQRHGQQQRQYQQADGQRDLRAELGGGACQQRLVYRIHQSITRPLSPQGWCNPPLQRWRPVGLAGFTRPTLDGAITVAGHQSITRPFSAKRPCGRFWMNRMISARIRILPSTAPICGSSSLLAMPRPKAASTLPASWPTPPSTTTRNESMM